MHAIIRTIHRNTLIGSSDFPYKYWQFDEIPNIIQSPVVYKVNDKEVLLAGRSVDSLCFVSLYKLTGNCLTDTLWCSQEGVDNAYPGLVRANNEMILSYYTGDKKSGAIYLKKFRMEPY